MKRPVTSTRASHAVREVTTHRPGRSSAVGKIGLRDRAERVASGKNSQTVTAGPVYDQIGKQAREAAMALSNSIEQRPLLALLVTGAIGFMIGLLRPRH